MKKRTPQPTLLLDARAIDFLPYGVGRYAREMAERLPLLRPDWNWLILRHDGAAKQTPRNRRGAKVIYDAMPYDDYPVEQQHWTSLYARYRPDLIHSLWFHTAEAADCIRVLSVQDVIALKGYPDFRTERFISRQPWYYRSLEAADALVVSSLHTLQDVEDMMHFPPDAIRHIPLACSDSFKKPSAKAIASVRKRYHLPAVYFFASGHYRNAYKNFDLILWAQSLLAGRKSKPPCLVVTGKGHTPSHDGVIHLGFVPDRDMAAIIAGSVALIYPSKDEGFGLPVLEAMACGTPVLCSYAGSIPEVAGKAAIYFDPSDPQELADAMQSILDQPALRRDLSEKGRVRALQFSWDRTAKKTVALYEHLLKQPRPKREPSCRVDWSSALLADKLPPPSPQPRTPGRFFQYAQKLIQQGHLRAAQTLLRQEAATFPNNPDALRELGKCLKLAGQWKKAAGIFSRMLKVAERLQAPDHLRSATFHLGECLLKLGKNKQAAQQLRRCLKIQPDQASAARLLALTK